MTAPRDVLEGGPIRTRTRYHESQVFVDKAEAAARTGDTTTAQNAYRQAAVLQRSMVESMPEARVRTKSVYGLSAATLFFRAGDLAEAERLATDLLSKPWICPDSAGKLRSLLDNVALASRRVDPAQVIGVGELAASLGVSRPTIYRWIDAGRVPQPLRAPGNPAGSWRTWPIEVAIKIVKDAGRKVPETWEKT